VLNTAVLVHLNELTNRTIALPVVVFFPTGRCNSRCVSCDWWRTSGENDLAVDEVARIAAELPGLKTRVVLFSGGEPLFRPDVFELAELFAAQGMDLHLLTSGIMLERVAHQVARRFARVIVSLDSATEDGYRAVRGVGALTAVERGVAMLRSIAPALPVTARSTLHRLNFRELPALVSHARAMALDGISFLAADVSSSAFAREHADDVQRLRLDRDEVAEFADLVERTIAECEDDFASGFIAESPDRLRRLPRYYAALNGVSRFPEVRCNAPYVSAVIEADGRVRPCFFHEPIGSVRERSFATIVRENLPAFRSLLSVGANPVCQRCVCSIKTTMRHAPWQ
jgi:MoaA/NifB/PqqE/SkfB family radical SAM enzyme